MRRTENDLLSNLQRLVEHYRDCDQEPVRFRPSSWEKALADIPGNPTALLRSLALTMADEGRHHGQGDRLVTRNAVIRACANPAVDKVIQTFVLVMAWGSGTTNPRSYRYTRMALRDVDRASYVLTDTSRMLRRAVRLQGDELSTAYNGFVLPGVGPSFFTKWFSFAGHGDERDWQPLILDRRVGSTINRTLRTYLKDLGAASNGAERYTNYVRSMHGWAHALNVSAERLEWIMFEHNGAELPATQSASRREESQDSART